MKKQQKAWHDHVEKLAHIFVSLYYNKDKRVTKRKRESDIQRYLEEEKDFPCIIEKDVILLNDMKVHDRMIFLIGRKNMKQSRENIVLLHRSCLKK